MYHPEFTMQSLETSQKPKRQKIVRFNPLGISQVGEIFRQARLAKRFSLEKVASLAGMPTAQINDVEKGRRDKLSADDVEALRIVLEPINPATQEVFSFQELFEICLTREILVDKIN